MALDIVDVEDKVQGCPDSRNDCWRDCKEIYCTEATSVGNEPIKVCCEGGSPIATSLSWSCTLPCRKFTCTVTEWNPNAGF